MNDGKVLAAVRRWGGARAEALRLRRERGSFLCVNEDPGDRETGWEPTPPCWKTREWSPAKEPEEDGDWCDRCRARQKVHRAYVAARKVAGAALRSLLYHLKKDAER